MSLRLSLAAAAVSLSLALPMERAAAQTTDTEILTNDAVVQMVAAKLSKTLVLGKISSARPGFDVSTDGIVALVGAKIDAGIIRSMLAVADSAHKKGNAPAELKGHDEVLTNDHIVRMVTSRVNKQVIFQKIQMSRTNFDVTANGLVELSKNKVPQDVIKVMMQPSTAGK